MLLYPNSRSREVKTTVGAIRSFLANQRSEDEVYIIVDLDVGLDNFAGEPHPVATLEEVEVSVYPRR